MKDNEIIINEILNSCLSGYSIYEDNIIECISKENRSLLRGITRKEQLKLLCDIITMAYVQGQGVTQKPVEVAVQSTDNSVEDDKVQFNNLISRDQYRKMKGMSRREFTDFIFELYKSIYEEHKTDVDYEKIRTEVLKINGIGNVKADAIVEAVKKCFEQ